jgi:Trk K+ transport system NAD-binding subunit
VTDYVRRLIEYPGALQVVDFAGGKVGLVAVKAYYGGPLVGNALSTLREHPTSRPGSPPSSARAAPSAPGHHHHRSG